VFELVQHVAEGLFEVVEVDRQPCSFSRSAVTHRHPPVVAVEVLALALVARSWCAAANLDSTINSYMAVIISQRWGKVNSERNGSHFLLDNWGIFRYSTGHETAQQGVPVQRPVRRGVQGARAYLSTSTYRKKETIFSKANRRSGSTSSSPAR